MSLVLAGPAVAQDDHSADDTPDFAAMNAEELVQTLRSSKNRWREEPCDFGEPLFTAMSSKMPDNPSVHRTLKFSQIFCADEQGEYAKGAAYVAELETTDPEVNLLSMALYFGRRSEDADGVLARLRKLDFDGASELDEESFWPVTWMIYDAGKADELNDLALEWSQTGIFGALSLNLQSGLAFRALGSAARQERGDLAGGLLNYITSPRSYVSLLTDRKYETIWPQIEQRAGKNLSSTGKRNVELTLARLENSPSDRDRFSDAAHALHFNGQFEDAIDLADQWQRREERGVALEEGDAWALNIQAYAYDSLGQTAKADAVFDRLAAVDPDENGWVVSFVINRASRLVGQGRWEEGLAATELARSVAEENGNTYAKLLIARDRACALLKLDRMDAAMSELEFMRENVDDGAKIVVQGLLCFGFKDEAAKIMLDMFADPDKRVTAIDAFEVGDLDLFYTQSLLPDASDLLATSPELAAELAKYMRPMPEDLIPAASLKRVKLDLPSWN
ncbi:hypothetical protein [uncultured Erythrobacter sp.]|uniref:hypothetical protein n=1 Tax=uncultured Erythrobacter sp. TaxID=263913 RepID=UPI00261143F0|nr:hypothetical protein [uncultured Erythrobacter sp.]